APPALPNEPLAVRHSTATAISMAILLFLLSDILHLSLLPARLMGRVDIKKTDSCNNYSQNCMTNSIGILHKPSFANLIIVNKPTTLYGYFGRYSSILSISCVVLCAEFFLFDRNRLKFFCNNASLDDKKLDFCYLCNYFEI